jgi:hypothetical protein
VAFAAAAVAVVTSIAAAAARAISIFRMSFFSCVRPAFGVLCRLSNCFLGGSFHRHNSAALFVDF